MGQATRDVSGESPITWPSGRHVDREVVAVLFQRGGELHACQEGGELCRVRLFSLDSHPFVDVTCPRMVLAHRKLLEDE